MATVSFAVSPVKSVDADQQRRGTSQNTHFLTPCQSGERSYGDLVEPFPSACDASRITHAHGLISGKRIWGRIRMDHDHTGVGCEALPSYTRVFAVIDTQPTA